MVKCAVVPTKGTQVNGCPAAWPPRVHLGAGDPEAPLKSDGETAIVDAKNRAKKLCQDMGINIAFQESPVGDSQANGDVVGANRVVEQVLEGPDGFLGAGRCSAQTAR